ncbi:DUF3551 domain-containing protein [Tardiphaga robiniae]|uniref:DUF3551 domain-containing protein n=1 Tax=Tardiphaga robiniae TaxID=943830 RepID=A0A7G6TU18_9BRAD|nr:DUF3551 domain-containing protein [Tardiphaga robiniae]QND70250.1 DUF3551 domain-containing protein [Tardiphaga robiniae]
MTFRYVALAIAIIVAEISFATAARSAPFLDRNLPFCTVADGGGSAWCGYRRTLAHCQGSASGTGHECIPNRWINKLDGRPLLRPFMATHADDSRKYVGRRH